MVLDQDGNVISLSPSPSFTTSITSFLSVLKSLGISSLEAHKNLQLSKCNIRTGGPMSVL